MSQSTHRCEFSRLGSESARILTAAPGSFTGVGTPEAEEMLRDVAQIAVIKWSDR